ncbi:MAG: galactose-1-phosphate uridylyltransferase [Candidatus Moranbacteria bacterium RIFCSPHIGHO2_12_FULL_54_9]|nr:MAG: galactose-1-phosphate uridylyltransferase [Candidatus Moranbacteria bacterium RIFCSPHIGHO2_01_FULL_54_31]OGI25302.1 MAG: galactose-1-phosphate uridylyltransferase [Candidatus Moranbacteria bacterium RIFCSPHIGHO2_12_FULL_54_9]
MSLGEAEKNKKAVSYDSELRQDIVTGDWVVIATGRAKRPDEFAQFQRVAADDAEDPFENPEASGQEQDILIYRRADGDWSLRVFPNKYPAFSRGRTARELSEGPYFAMTGAGYHEVIVTQDARRSLALLDVWEGAEVFDAYQERYLALMNKKSVNYIQIFHNHGKEAGASLPHPHSQLMAIPVISPYIALELTGAERYYQSTKRKVYGMITEYESETKKRVIFENEHFIAFCPFASRAAFEIWIVGKRANPYFERITDEEKFAVAEALQRSLYSLYQGLNDPPYNFYIHTAPCDGKDYPHYQWHIEILPHTATWAGFELSTGIEVSTLQPEAAAEYLRSQLNS